MRRLSLNMMLLAGYGCIVSLVLTGCGGMQVGGSIAPGTHGVSGLPGVVAWGDSLTLGGQGIADQSSYPSELQNAITLPVVNMGFDALTSTQIGVRQGGVTTSISVDAPAIPATGSVNVTFPAGYNPVHGAESESINGTILGVHGTVTFHPDTDVFTRSAAGNSVSAPTSTPFVVDTPYAKYFPIFWEGMNNPTQVSQVLSDIARQVATAPSGQDYLVLSLINDNVTSEWAGGPVYANIVAINKQLPAAYGSHYLDARKVLVDNYDSTMATDASDYNHDEPPTSLRAVLGKGTLAAAIGPTDTSFDVNMTTGPLGGRTGMILTIDTGANQENVLINATAGTTVTAMRNFGGANVAHGAGAPVSILDPSHLNAQGYQLVANAVAQYLLAHE